MYIYIATEKGVGLGIHTIFLPPPTKTHVASTHLKCLAEAPLMDTHNTRFAEK